MNRPILYVAFVSQATVSRAQLEEIATDLELSGLDFMWLVRSKWLDHEDELEGMFGDRGRVIKKFINQLVPEPQGHQRVLRSLWMELCDGEH
jgi:hypothetical protein